MKLLTKVKKTVIGKIVRRCVRFLDGYKILRKYEHDFLRYSATNLAEDNEQYLRLRILVLSHVIEKGLSHGNYRPGFGKQNIIELCSALKKYSLIENADKFALSNAYELVALYHEENLKHGFDDSDYVSMDMVNNAIKTGKNGIKYINILKQETLSYPMSFAEFSNSRSSVRLFEQKGQVIDNDILFECVKIAQNAPNACNRQAVRVHIIKAQNLYDEIEKLQLGCSGFGKNASAFIFINSDLSLYTSTEMKLPIFDAGMFTMNLVYALQDKGIYSCVLNPGFIELNGKFKNKLGIPDNQSINGLLVVYKVENLGKIKVPFSARREVETICSIVE